MNKAKVLTLTLASLIQMITQGGDLVRAADEPNALVPNQINYQGYLADAGGSPLDGTYGISFAIYDNATLGNLIWGPESHPAVSVSSGLFFVMIGSQTAGGIPSSLWQADRYLEISVAGEILAPRLRMSQPKVPTKGASHLGRSKRVAKSDTTGGGCQSLHHSVNLHPSCISQSLQPTTWSD